VQRKNCKLEVDCFLIKLNYNMDPGSQLNVGKGNIAVKPPSKPSKPTSTMTRSAEDDHKASPTKPSKPVISSSALTSQASHVDEFDSQVSTLEINSPPSPRARPKPIRTQPCYIGLQGEMELEANTSSGLSSADNGLTAPNSSTDYTQSPPFAPGNDTEVPLASPPAVHSPAQTKTHTRPKPFRAASTFEETVIGKMRDRASEYTRQHRLRVVCGTWNMNNQTLDRCPTDDLCDWLTLQTEQQARNVKETGNKCKPASSTSSGGSRPSNQSQQNQQLQQNINEVVDNIMQQFTEKLSANSSNIQVPPTSPKGTESQPSFFSTRLGDIYAVGMQEIVDLVPTNIVFNTSVTYQRSVYWLGQLLKAFDRLHIQECEQLISQQLGNINPQLAYETLSAKGMSPFVCVAEEHLVGMQIFIFVRSHLIPHVCNIQTLNVGVGAFGYMGNKGAVGICMQIFECSMSFMCSHLRSGSGAENCKGRCDDYFSILERGIFGAEVNRANINNNYSDELYASAIEQANLYKTYLNMGSSPQKQLTQEHFVNAHHQEPPKFSMDSVDLKALISLEEALSASSSAAPSAHTSVSLSTPHNSLAHASAVRSAHASYQRASVRQLEDWNSGRFSGNFTAGKGNRNSKQVESNSLQANAESVASFSEPYPRSGISPLRSCSGFDRQQSVSSMLNLDLVNKWRRRPVWSSSAQTAHKQSLRQYSGPLDHDIVFWFGDFNYRLDTTMNAEEVVSCLNATGNC
jgi:hypothetical protein